MKRLSLLLVIPAMLVSACGDGGQAPKDEGSKTRTAPTIATDMESPVEDPFCYFAAEGAEPLTGDAARYVFVTKTGKSVYQGYASLDGEVTKLTEVEAGFGAGMETRRFVSGDDSVELEVILLEAGEDEVATSYTGSVRVIYPVEGEAVKFYGECRHESVAE